MRCICKIKHLLSSNLIGQFSTTMGQLHIHTVARPFFREKGRGLENRVVRTYRMLLKLDIDYQRFLSDQKTASKQSMFRSMYIVNSKIVCIAHRMPVYWERLPECPLGRHWAHSLPHWRVWYGQDWKTLHHPALEPLAILNTLYVHIELIDLS